MKYSISILFLSFSLAGYTQINRSIGSNLSGVVDWSPEYVFTNVTKQGREWISHGTASGSAWSSGVHVPLRSDGYPLEIPYNNSVDPAQGVRMLMFFGELNDLYPGGNYRLIASGQGQIRFLGAATGTFKCPIDTIVYVDSSRGGIIMEIDSSLVTNPVHDIRFILPKYRNTYQSQPINEKFIDFIDDFQTLRFMDWMHTNFSPVETWSDRTPKNYYTQTLESGVAYEHIIDVCNQFDKNAWICVPHRANDNYITNLAKLFNDSLKPGLKIYVEYSNEVWNSLFAQSTYADSMGNALGYSGAAWEKGWKFYSKRCADVFRLFENEITDTSRFVKVIASQAANPWLSDYILDRFEETTYNPTDVKADAIAVAPYFGGRVADDIGDAGLISTATIPQILDSMEADLPQVFKWMRETKVVADTHRVEFMAYEGGQHLVAVNPSYQNDTGFVSKLIRANRDPRMQTMYCRYFDYWYDSIQGGLFSNFSSHYLPNKYGAWGAKEHYNDTLAPKYLALKSCVFSSNTNPTSVIEHAYDKFDFKVYPNPSTNLIHIEIETEGNSNYILYSVNGQVIKEGSLSSNTIDVSAIQSGVYFLKIVNNEINYNTKKVIISK